MKKEYRFGLGGLLIGLIAGLLIFQSVASISRRDMMKGSATGNPQTELIKNGPDMDAHFIEQMIPHHEDAITMAKLAQNKAKRPEVKKLADEIIVAQEEEIGQMKSWYRSWYGREIPAGEQVMNQHGMMGGSRMHMGMTGTDDDMAGLEQAPDFDKTFITMMIPHHQMAVMMAGMLEGGTRRPEMKQLASDIISAQTKEIDQMRDWLKNW